MPVARTAPTLLSAASPSQYLWLFWEDILFFGISKIKVSPLELRVHLHDFFLGNSLKETQSCYALPDSLAFLGNLGVNFEFFTNLKPVT